MEKSDLQKAVRNALEQAFFGNVMKEYKIMSALDQFIIEHDTELLEGVAKELERVAVNADTHVGKRSIQDAALLIRSHIPKV